MEFLIAAEEVVITSDDENLETLRNFDLNATFGPCIGKLLYFYKIIKINETEYFEPQYC